MTTQPEAILQAGSFSKAELITPADSDLATLADAVWVGGAGAVNLILADDTAAVLFSGIPAGTLLPFKVKQIQSTGLTASLIVALRV